MEIEAMYGHAGEPDIKFRRLAISIEKCSPLHRHYFRRGYMEQACEYWGLQSYPTESNRYNPPEITRGSLARFLDQLRRQNPQTFISLMTYVLKDIFLARRFINGMWDSEDEARFEDFKRDLGSVGFHLEDYRVIPSVGGGIEQEIAMVDELNGLLREINPEFPKMREGAWETFLSRSPDGDRQAISSIRELFDHVVDSLSDKPTWKERIASIVGGADAEVISSSAELAKAMYGLQSKGTHDEPSYPRAFFIIKMTEYSLHYLLRSYLSQKK